MKINKTQVEDETFFLTQNGTKNNENQEKEEINEEV